MSEVRQYVLIYLPLTMAAIGALIVWGRRREHKGRRHENSTPPNDGRKDGRV